MPHVGVTVYDMLLSCPGDVVDLKDTIDACVKSFNSSIGEVNRVRIELKHWSTNSFSQFGDKPQNILNKQFIDDCDLCVALLGIRFGTPTDNYDSGTEEEIEKMLAQNKQVFLYFVERNVDPSKIDLDQYKKVQEFKKKYTDRGAYTVVKSAEELRTVFQNALSLYFIKLVAPNTTQLQPTLAPKLVISSTKNDGIAFTPFHTNYQRIKLVKDKEDSIKGLINQISAITIIPSAELALEEFESEISDEELQEMAVSDVLKAAENKKITSGQFHRVMGTKPPEYIKVEVDETQKQLVTSFCEKHRVKLNATFFYLGNLQKEIKTPFFTAIGGSTTSYYGSESEKEKNKLLEDLLFKLQDYKQVIEFLGNIDSMPCVSLQIENKGNTFDEDIDVKLFVEKDCFADINNIPKPGLFFLEEAVELKVPKALFCGHHHADIEDYSNYPIVPYIPQTFSNPFKSRSEEMEEKQEEYQEMLENVFCYDLRENEKDDILFFKIPYLKQNTKMFFPSYLFFTKKPKNLRYEIRSKYSPEVYKGTLELEDGSEAQDGKENGYRCT